MNPLLSPDERAQLILGQMTPDEKLRLLSSTTRSGDEKIRLAGLVPGIDRLGIRPIKESNAGLGVAIPLDEGHSQPEDQATALPSGLAIAATWDPQLAYAAGGMIGEEARRKGLTVLLAGAANLARDPRSGRNFEYAGEDPLLAGTMVGEAIHGISDRHVISTLKHFALNDQETRRNSVDARIDRAALHESDLLAFEIAEERGKPGAVMCAYNLVNGVQACEHPWLLDGVLRREWGFRGWVMSDWGAAHSTVRAAQAGLDQQSGVEWDPQAYFGDRLAIAIEEGKLPLAQLDAMALHVLRVLFASGVVDDPSEPAPLDTEGDAAVAHRVAAEGMVLLKNDSNALPLSRDVGKLAVIGGHGDVGVLSGGGSSQVIPIGGPAVQVPFPDVGAWMIYDPSPPLRAIAAKATGGGVDYADGSDIDAAVALAQQSDAVIVFATKWESEGHDAEDLSLPDDQDRLIAAVAAANKRTIVVLETGNPVLMPWRNRVAAILEAWYPGARGGDAIADILFGDASPSGRLPMTFPAAVGQLPRTAVPGEDVPWGTRVVVDYREGAAIGYKWFAARDLEPLYPFGFGLTYSRFRYSGLQVQDDGGSVTASFAVTNSGEREAADVPQLYARVSGADGKPVERLVGWSRVNLAPGESARVSLKIDPRLLAHFDAAEENWRIDAGTYPITLGASAADRQLATTARLKDRILPP
ncbi:MAG TPA: glycoside hydrolase family 3 C-terminal domain-containing protein [Stellaceae bacterium]|jgi:beta-glucosidase|nr:glycoside hydrolase family 3 C-terminal domain-containing protein [Stellaceae bacterium]